jgi:hypothetical protein
VILGSFVIDGTTSQSTKPASWQVAGYPAQAGIQQKETRIADKTYSSRFAGLLVADWIPAFAGMTWRRRHD